MAIIRKTTLEPDQEFDLESIILRDVRPAIVIKDGTFRLDGRVGPWATILESQRHTLERAISAVGRLETADRALPLVGSAFVVTKKLAVTVSYVAELFQRTRGWLNLGAELETAASTSNRIPISNVHFVHPYWGIAFLELEHEVEVQPLPLAPKQSAEDLKDRNICVIGFPAKDIRNDPKAMHAIFGDIYDVKRLMPGKVMDGFDRYGPENTNVVRHDATTTGGTSGAPLIDIEHGYVLGVQTAGKYLVANYALPAWELTRDPQWQRVWHSDTSRDPVETAEVSRQAIGLTGGKKRPRVFSSDEVIELHAFLVTVINDDKKIQTLFSGLPPEYVGALPGEGSPALDKLLSRLHGVNSMGGLIEDHSAFYYLLRNASSMRSWDSAWTTAIEGLLSKVRARERREG